MKKRTCSIAILLGLFLASPPSFATAETPVVQGLAGAGRAGNPRESLFSNPAAVAFVTNTFGFLHYTKPRIADLNAGGRTYNVGIYDGGNESWKGGFAYTREARAILLNGRQAYEDRSEFRFATAHAITGNIAAGGQFRYIGLPQSGDRTVHIGEGDLGAVFPIFADMRGGVTAENVLNREPLRPLTLGLGAVYPAGYGITLYGDGTQVMKGDRKNYKGYSLAGELVVSGDFTLRGGRFQEAYRKMKGWSLGLSWLGPRAGFDYALKFTGKGPREKAHIFGMTVVL